jgi:hypothetical protein
MEVNYGNRKYMVAPFLPELGWGEAGPQLLFSSK